MRIAGLICGSFLIGLAITAPVQADFVVFKVPTTKIKFVMQGKVIDSRSQPTLNFTHISKQIFDLPKGADTEVIVLPALSQIGTKRLVKAKGNESSLREVAVWCLEHGLLPEFHKAMDQLAAINASDPFAVESKRLKEDFGKALPDTSAAEAELLKDYGGSTGKVVKSTHFLLVHDGEKPEKSDIKRKRPESRVEQLEQLLEMFIMKCAERGLPVRVPTAPLKVALVSKIPKKAQPGERTLPLDRNIFWSANQNVLFIDDRSKIASLDALKKLQGEVQKQSEKPKAKRNQPGGAAPPGGMAAGGGAGDLLGGLSATQLSKLTISLQALMSIGIENHELEAVSREAAYMFLANCGVVSPKTPQWMQDGLAAYFEFPEELGWGKIGDLGQVRQAWYQASLQDPDRITIADIVSGACYEDALSTNGAMRAGTQAWALMHYLLQTKPEGVAQYLSNFQSMPPDVAVGEDVLSAMFDQAFDADRAGLEKAWHDFMTTWKADYLILQEEEGGGTTTEN